MKVALYDTSFMKNLALHNASLIYYSICIEELTFSVILDYCTVNNRLYCIVVSSKAVFEINFF